LSRNIFLHSGNGRVARAPQFVFLLTVAWDESIPLRYVIGEYGEGVPHPRFLRVGVLVWHAEGDWPWSSFSFYAKDQTGLVVIDVVDL
jgi:hypothetical protein